MPTGDKPFLREIYMGKGLAHVFRGCNPRKSPRCFQITTENKKSAGALFAPGLAVSFEPPASWVKARP